jgi:hypothetical protein
MVAERRSDAIASSSLGAQQLDGALIASLSGCTDSASQVFGFSAILVLGWPGGSARIRWAAGPFSKFRAITDYGIERVAGSSKES